MRKKLIALFSAAAMVITVMCSAFPVAAAGTLLMQTKASKSTIKQGETVTVDLVITQNPGLVSIQTQAVYDKDAFEMVSVAAEAPFTGFTYMESQNEDKSQVWWTNFGMSNDSTATGKLFSVTFKAKETVENGSFDFSFGTWGDAVFNYDGDDVVCTVEKTIVNVSDGLSDDATLKSLTVSNGTLSPAFDPAVEEYTVAVPYGKGVPKVTAVKNDANATVQIVQAESYESGKNEATVTVTAQNKKNVKTYKITFTEINAVLSALTVNGVSVAGFDPDTTSYTYTVPYADWNADKAKTYTIAATASKETSEVEIGENDFTLTSTDPDKNSDKNVTVKVTSDRGDETLYTIKFTVLTCQHDYEINEAGSTPATCTDAGENLFVCSVCGKEKTETAAALGHDRTSPWTTVPAGCETDGSRTQICTRCGETIATEVIPKTGHKWSHWTNVEGTENYERTCSNINCEIGTQSRVVMGEADGHTHDFDSVSCQTEILKNATCTEKGEKRVWCANEGCAGFLLVDIDMLPHNFIIETVSEATCTEEGSRREICTVCGLTGPEEIIDPMGHDFDEGTWEKDDSGHWHICRRCGAESDKDSHTENEGVVTTPATSYSNGTRTYSCTVCGYVMRTEIIPAEPTGDGNASADYSGGYIGAPVIPFGGIKTTESITVSVENKITGKTGTASAQRNGSSVTVDLGAENDGYYANVYTTDDEYIYSALIENGRAKLNVSSDVKIKVIIDSIAYGEDVSSASAVSGEANEIPSGNIVICLISVVLIAGAAVMTVFIKKRAEK